MIKINVVSNNSKWDQYLKKPERYIDNKVKNINLRYNNFKDKVIFCTLLLSGDFQIKKLNSRFRNKNKSTDVLSFPFYNKKDLKKKFLKEKEIYLGDIIINLNKIINKKDNKNFKGEFNKLWVHGLVHLLGHDHKKEKDFKNMEKVEKKLISYLK